MSRLTSTRMRIVAALAIVIALLGGGLAVATLASSAAPGDVLTAPKPLHVGSYVLGPHVASGHAAAWSALGVLANVTVGLALIAGARVASASSAPFFSAALLSSPLRI